MAEWKKIIVSGSDANLANLQVDSLSSGLVTGNAGNLTTTAINGYGNILATSGSTGVTIGALTDSHFTGSFTGSFTGNGAGLTGVTATFPTSQITTLAGTDKYFTNDGTNKFVSGAQVQDFVYSGVSSDITIAAGGAATIAANAVDNSKLADMTQGTIKVGGTSDAPTDLVANGDGNILIGDGTNITSVAVSGDVTINNTGATTIATSLGALGTNAFTGSFTGSFTGDGSGLTGLATTLTVGDENSTQTVDLVNDTLKFVDDENTIETTVNKVGNNVEITASLAATIPGNRTFSGNTITINNDLVVQGTASFQETENLRIADRFILLASGSSTAGDGGLVVQQTTADTGELFGFDSATSRWAVTSSFHASQSAFTPQAYMPLVINDDDNDVAAYQKDGNIKISDAGEIYIYVE